MKEKGFPFPMSKSESIVGWVWVFVHTFALSIILSALYHYVLREMGITLTDTQFNLIYYGVSLLFLLIFLFNFLRSSLRLFASNVLDSVTSIAIYYIVYNAAMYIISWVLRLVFPAFSNPNQESVEELTKLNPGSMIVISIFLAPIVEEILFRGVVFGTLRKKNVFLAYAISALLFGLYHVWSYFFTGFSWNVLVSVLIYVPAGLALARCYERSKNVWASVLLHMIINFVSITIQLGA